MFEIEVPIVAVPRLYETNTIKAGMERETPGGATIHLTRMPMEKRHHPGAVTLFTIAVTYGKDIAVGLFVNWLYEHLKESKAKEVIINRRTTEVTPEGLRRVIEETIISREG